VLTPWSSSHAHSRVPFLAVIYLHFLPSGVSWIETKAADYRQVILQEGTSSLAEQGRPNAHDLLGALLSSRVWLHVVDRSRLPRGHDQNSLSLFRISCSEALDHEGDAGSHHELINSD
jgi:hypothetical protein